MGSLSWQADEDLPADMEQARLYRQARQRVHVRFGFYYHFAIYVIVVSGLFVLDILNGTDHFFVQWVAGGFASEGSLTSMYQWLRWVDERMLTTPASRWAWISVILVEK